MKLWILFLKQLHVLIVTALSGSGLLLSLLAGNTAGTTLAVGRVKRKVDVFFWISSNEEGRDVHELFADADMSLSDQHAGMVHWFGKTKLEYLNIQSVNERRIFGNATFVCNLLSRKICVVSFKMSSSEFSSSLMTPYRFRRLINGGVSNNLFGSLGSSVNNVLAALRTFDNKYWTLQISRLHRRPYSPHKRSSWSRRSFS